MKKKLQQKKNCSLQNKLKRAEKFDLFSKSAKTDFQILALFNS